eukprot:6247329-Amphidinium_carterae.1
MGEQCYKLEIWTSVPYSDSLTATSTSEAKLLGAANADEALKAIYLVLAEMTGSYMMPADPCG